MRLEGPRDRPCAAPPGSPRVVLCRAVDSPIGSGPFNGQYALQKALRARLTEDQDLARWLWIAEKPEAGDFPWFWCWEDIPEVLRLDDAGRSCAVGPNVMFAHSRAPGAGPGERRICDSPHVKIFFVHSEWYARLVRETLGPESRATTVVCPYPVDPRPGEPLPASYDLLVYFKSGPEELVEALARSVPRTKILRYGRYAREELYDAASRSRACAYLSVDDHGPLALAEILLAGCPATGLRCGAPFIESGTTGVYVNELSERELTGAIREVAEWDREQVRHRALEMFDTSRILETIIDALDAARRL